jgi:L-threonylcarbamoyladenylate synthase
LTGKDIHYASLILKNGGLVSIPTETVYGLAASAYNPNAIANVFKAKNRPFFDPLIVHIGKPEQALELFTNIPDVYLKLMNAFWPGPLTLVAHKSDKVPDLVTSGNPMVAVRMPQHSMTLELLSNLVFPLVAPSANPFGYVSPTTAQHVEQQLGNKIDYILDGGPCKVGIESTIVGLHDGVVEVWRLGGIGVEEIEKVVGYKPVVKIQTHSNPKVPGQLDKHYSPGKPVKLLKSLDDPEFQSGSQSKFAFIGYGDIEKPQNCSLFVNLSPDADDVEGASKIYDALRTYANSDESMLYVLLWPESGLGLAINDRLRRAAKD